MIRQETNCRSLLPLVGTLFGLVVIFHLGGALLGKPLFRPDHLGTALEYAGGSIDLLRPVNVGFNATGTPTALEFPVWQAASALIFKIAHSTWYGWANLVSLLFFASALWPFFQLARQHVGQQAAWWSLAFFLAQPLIVIYSGEAGTDGFSLVVMIWFVFFANKFILSGDTRWWLPTAFLAALSAVSKLPFCMAAGLFTFFAMLVYRVRDARRWFLLASAGAFAAIVFAAWTHHADALAAQAEYPFVELRVSHSPATRFWYFGDLQLRLSPGPWLKGVWRFLHGTMGSLPLAGLLILALTQTGSQLPKAWLLATFLTTLVFTHLVLTHWHYYLMCCPAVAMLCGATLARWQQLSAHQMPRFGLLGLAGLVLVFSALDGLIAMKIALDYDSFTKEMSDVIRQHTKPEDKLIVYDAKFHPWGGEKLYRSGRKGLCVENFEQPPWKTGTKALYELLDNEADLGRLKALGYNRLILVSESPVLFAAQAINPGAKRTRYYYPASISPKVDAWPVIYRTEDILIKEIP